MKKRVLFMALSTVAYAQSANVGEIVVEDSVITATVKDVSGEELKSADLAEALGKNIPSAALIRRSGIANDIILRGQKRDNINIIIDGTKVCGACVNRMDPPTSHVSTNLVNNVQVQEGPFDVENFGTLSGVVNVTTKEPTKELSGELNINAGSFGYKKASAAISGGNDKIKVLVSASTENGEQYEDGNGDTFAGQLAKATTGTTSAGHQYQPKYEEMDAFEKSTFMAKILAHITDSQDLRLSYTGNRNDNVLYPSSKMDAIWDDSDIFNVEYQIRDLAKYSKAIDFQYYNSQVDHPMSIRYRKSELAKGDITNHLKTKMQGFKLKNSFDIDKTNIIVGLDTSRRNWNGQYFKSVEGDYMRFPPASPTAGEIKRSINDGETKNNAIFVKTRSAINNIDLDFGARYDDTTVENGGTAQNNDYDAISANIFATFNVDEDTRYFAGIGKSTRVPDPRELYFMSSMAPNANTLIGTPALDQTTNYEIDLGFEKIYDNFSIKTKVFYSILKDYIYLNGQKNMNVFENIDATIYGAEISGAYLAADSFYIDYGIAYKKGEKDEPIAGQSDTDLADISPLKTIIGLNYDYDDSISAKLDIIGASAWDDYDSDNGEQALDGYVVLNLKLKKEFTNGFELTFGIDNVLDEAYTTTNTYKDLTLITTGTAAGTAVDDVMLLNEPGRYFYINGTYKF